MTAEQRMARYQNLMAKHYNSNVRRRDFQVGNLVLQKVMGATRDPSQGKLGPNLEGSYRIASWQRKDTYHLETLNGQKFQHPWNTEHLRKYYQQGQHEEQRRYFQFFFLVFTTTISFTLTFCYNTSSILLSPRGQVLFYLLQYFEYLFKPKGAGTFLQIHD